MIKTSRHIPGLPHISDELRQDIGQWHGFSLHEGRHQGIQGRRSPNNMQRGTNPHWHPKKPRTIPNTADATTRPLATTTPIQTGTESTTTGQQRLMWMHAVCGYPVKLTWLKATKAGNYIGCPMLTERNVQKYYPKTTKTAKGSPEPNKKECTVHQS